MTKARQWKRSCKIIMLLNSTLAEYAKLTCKSIPTFKRDFKKIFNDTPAKWVMKKRLNLATDLLENTPLSIGEITFECGFENQTHFSRVFKEKMGVSPSQFRKSSGNNCRKSKHRLVLSTIYLQQLSQWICPAYTGIILPH